jgi:hypothetical protein
MSQTKSQIARANGAKSHGPVTAEGKAISSRNSLRHGLTSTAVVLPGESPEEFQSLLDGYIDQFQPATAVDTNLTNMPPDQHLGWVCSNAPASPFRSASIRVHPRLKNETNPIPPQPQIRKNLHPLNLARRRADPPGPQPAPRPALAGSRAYPA